MISSSDTVLVVEDDALVRTVAVMLLEEELGCSCETASDRNSALRLLQDHAARITAVFTDVRMATDTDGLELARIVSRRWPWIAILVTSAGYAPKESALPAKANFIRKPWHPEEIKLFLFP
jgi:CheY-like chemotaxis protein